MSGVVRFSVSRVDTTVRYVITIDMIVGIVGIVRIVRIARIVNCTQVGSELTGGGDAIGEFKCAIMVLFMNVRCRTCAIRMWSMCVCALPMIKMIVMCSLLDRTIWIVMVMRRAVVI